MTTISVYFAKYVDLAVLRHYFESYTCHRYCRNIDTLVEIDDTLEMNPRIDAIAFSLKYGSEKKTKVLIKNEDGTCTDTEVTQVEFKTGSAIIKQYSDHLLIMILGTSGSAETLNVVSYALKGHGSKPIPTDISEEKLEELLGRQKSIIGTKVEKNTRVSSMTLDGELVNRSPDGKADACQEYSEEKGPKMWARYVTFENKIIKIYHQNPVKINCSKISNLDLEDYITKDVVPLITWAYREM